MIGKWGFSLLPFYLGIIPIFANNNYTLTTKAEKAAGFPPATNHLFMQK